MSTLYPRTISLRRPNATGAVGATGYGGVDPVNETVLMSGIPANISYERVGRGNPTNLPTTSRQSTWLIVLPSQYSTAGQILPGDMIVDDQGLRYKVYAPDWQVLGYNLHVELMYS
jgi:hypothetical protein